MPNHADISRHLAHSAREIARASHRWLLEQAFPFWAERAPDPAGGFYETLDLGGHGITGKDSRVRLQARMGFTFALAAELGWDRARARTLADRSVAVLVNDCRRPDGLYGTLVRPGTGLVDDTAQAYDTAFALLAFATVYRVFRSEAALDAGTNLSLAIDRVLARPKAKGGFCEYLPAPAIRLQNPHMHLTEASLAWYEATGEQASQARTNALVTFVESHFYRPDLGLLLEKHGIDDTANHAEAGHMFEWVWILGRQRELGGPFAEEFAAGLHSGGLRLLDGLDYLPLSQEIDGSVREARQRTWGPSEKLKAHIATWRVDRSTKTAKLVVAAARSLIADHIEGALPGAWIDVISPEREPMIRDITPATGYHLFLALKEFLHFADELELQVNQV